MAISIMPKLLMTVSLATLFLTILPESADSVPVRGTIVTAKGYECTWEETWPGKSTLVESDRGLMLKCECNHRSLEREDENIKFSCTYLSDVQKCCPELSRKESDDHYHRDENILAYYSQAAIILMRGDFPCTKRVFPIKMCDSDYQWNFMDWNYGSKKSQLCQPGKSRTQGKPQCSTIDKENEVTPCHLVRYTECPKKPSSLQALINAWIQLKKIGHNQK